MTDCWSDERIEAMARARIERTDPSGADASHLDDCDDCRSRVEAAAREHALLVELRAADRRHAPTKGGAPLVPGYWIDRELHRGGQGIVYRALQERTKRVVALKVLLGGASSTERERRRFDREIELASRLDHPGIVTLYDSGVAGRTPWCAMELVEGVPLDEWARTNRAPLRARIELARRVAAAIAHAHHKGVIHRDLKPANVLVDLRGDPHVLDFGAALDEAGRDERVRITAPGEFLGTLHYAAPEQLSGRHRAIDTRTDVYALGVILYELATGALPFDRRGGVAEIAEQVTKERPPLPSTRARGVDRDLDAIAMKALATDPAERYGTAEALERDLARWLAREPVEARRQSLRYVLWKHLARRKRAVAVAACVIVAGGALAIAWIAEHRRAERQVEEARLARSIIQDLLAAPSPQKMGGDARLLDVYEVVARDLDSALVRAPDVQAQVELTIGDTYRRLLRTAESEPHLVKALARFREIDDRREIEVARAANALALSLAAVHRRDAIDVATEALGIRERELDGGDPRVAESRRTLAIALLEQFQPTREETERARVLLDRALDDLAARGGDGPELAETKLWRARAGDDLSPRAREALLASALETLERSASKDPRALDALTSYASFLQREERFDEARALLDRAGILARDLYGGALAVDMLRRQARLEFARGNHASAERLSRQAIARELERWGDRNAASRASLRALAKRVEEPGPPAFEPPFAEAFQELRALEGDGSFELASWMNGVVAVLRALDRGAATVPILREALAIHCRAMGADCPIRRKSIELLATELATEQRGAEAVELLEESIATFERVDEGASPEAARARELLAQCRAQVAPLALPRGEPHAPGGEPRAPADAPRARDGEPR